MRTITFNELRKIKDSLPSGSMHRIADELGLNVDTVRNNVFRLDILNGRSGQPPYFTVFQTNFFPFTH